MKTNLFNLTSGIQPKVVSSKLISDINITENVLSDTVAYLDLFNESVGELEKLMISNVLESESTVEENRSMANYYKQYSLEVKKLINKINQQKDKFIINMNVFIDANKDIELNMVDYIQKDISYSKTIYRNIKNPNIPCISVKEMFKKEYLVLGKLLQDLKGTSITDDARINAISSVYFALLDSIDTDWLDLCVRAITGCDTCKSEEFSEVMYNNFVAGQRTITINEIEINQAKYILSSSDSISKQIQASFDMLLDELNEVASNIGAMWFRNAENVVDITTDEDGLMDAKYRLTDYSMSQVNKITKSKIDQLNEVINLYTIALSIKMDCAIKEMKQARDIITIATAKVHDSDEDNSIEEESKTLTTSFYDFNTSDIWDDDIMVDYSNDKTESRDGENKDYIEDESSAVMDENFIFDKDCYLFTLEVSRISRLADQLNMQSDIYTAIQEADAVGVNPNFKSAKDAVNRARSVINTDRTSNASSDSNKSSTANNTVVTKTDNVTQSKTSEKINEIREKLNMMIANLINKMRELVQKFMEVIIRKNKSRIEEIKNHEKQIKENGAKGGGTSIQYNTKAIIDMKINIDFAANKDVLSSQVDYVKKAFNIDLNDGKSFQQALIDKVVLGEGKPQPVTGQTVIDGYNYITREFEIISSYVQKAQNDITVKSKNVKIEAQKYMNESTMESTMFQYFTEFQQPETASSDDSINQNKESKNDIVSKMMLMYKTNCLLLTTKMSLAQKAFNEYYAICKFFIDHKVD